MMMVQLADLVVTSVFMLILKKVIKFYELDKKPFQDAVKSVYTKNAKRVGGMAAIRQVSSQ